MRFLFSILFFVQCSFALSINESLLKIHAVLLPKIVLMDYNFENKLRDNTITIAILYDANEYKSAVLLKEELQNRYQNRIKNYTIKTVLLPYSKVKYSSANLYYLLPSKKSNVKKVIQRAREQDALTFSYIASDLKRGVMLSLKIGAKIKPIINLKAVRSNNITFRPVLLKISHIYTTKSLNNESSKSIYNQRRDIFFIASAGKQI